MIRVAQLILVIAAGALWLSSHLTWVDIDSFDGLGQPKSAALDGATWSPALIPLALLLLAAAVAALAVRGWPLRLLAVLVAAASAGMAYPGISQWVVADVAVRAANLAEVPVADLIDTQRHYGGAIAALVAAALALVGAVLLMRSATTRRAQAARYAAPAARREAAAAETTDAVDADGGEVPEVSERTIWDALDEGRDPTDPDNKGR